MSAPGSLGGCEQRVQAAAYVLGSLEAEEAARYREHLGGCTECRQDLAELQAVVDLLPGAAPPAAVPPWLRDRVMGVVRSEAALLNATGREADRPPARPRWRLRPLGVLTGALATGAGVAVGALALAGGGSNVRQTPGIVASAPDASAVLRQAGGRSELDVTKLPPAPPGHIYQVWLQRSRQAPTPTDALFGVNRAGRAAVAVPGSLAGVKQVMVTAEPLGGSDKPSEAPIITVDVTHA